MADEKGGSDAAFFLSLFAVAVLGFGGSVQYPLAVLRAGGFATALWFLWRSRREAAPVSLYLLLVGGFALLALGHAFSSTYFWVSFQHAVNIALAAILLAWAVRWFRRDPGRAWNTTVLAVLVLAATEVSIALFQSVHGGELRPRGTFDNANYLSEFLATASILALSRAFRSEGPVLRRCGWGTAAAAFLAAGSALGGSRGVLFASVPAFGVLLFWRFGLRRGAGLLAGFGLPALFLFGFRAAERLLEADLYGYSRWIIWKSALRTFLEHPFGVGLGGFKYYWLATQSPVVDAFRRYGKFADTAHNEYLEVLSGLGLVGFLLFVTLLAYPLFLAFRYRKKIAPDRRPIAAGAAGVLVLSGAHALVNSNFHVFGIFFLDASMLGALLSCLPRDSALPVTLPAWTRGLGAAVCVLLFGVTFATLVGVYQYDRGEKLLRSGDLPGAERAFSAAMVADPFRSSYPDALSSVHYRRYLAERPSMAKVRNIPESMFETLRWEDRARQLAPRDLKYTLRLSQLFFELLRLRGEPSDALMSLRFADGSLRINPYGVETLWHKAEVLSFLGNGEDALRELETAVSVEPNFCRGYAKLADLARGTDPVTATRWSRAEGECGKRASAVHLEENEKWMVEPPEDR